MLWPLFDSEGDDRHVPTDVPCVDDDRNWFWTTLDRWPDPEITNGPKIVTSSALAAWRTLCAARRGDGERRRCVLNVFVRARRILGAVVAEPSGNGVLDDLARRLYPPPPAVGEEVGAEVFRVSVYGRGLRPEDTFNWSLDDDAAR